MVTEREREYLYLLCRIKGLGAVTIRRLREIYDSFESIYYIEETGREEDFPALHRVYARIMEGRGSREKILEEYHRMADRGIQFITSEDEEYPVRLKEIYDYPMGLCVKGRLPAKDSPAAAIVGARENTEYGRAMAEWYGRELSAAGVWVVSGLARGTDSAAHRGALQAGGRTAAVLGSGVEVCYPRENQALYREIGEKGCLISEFGQFSHAQSDHQRDVRCSGGRGGQGEERFPDYGSPGLRSGEGGAGSSGEEDRSAERRVQPPD